MKKIRSENSDDANLLQKIIAEHEGPYPIATEELQRKSQLSKRAFQKNLLRLEEQNKIKSKKVTWVNSYKIMYSTADKEWPEFLGKKCRNCHNKSTIKTCIFHNALHEQGEKCDRSRVKKKMQKNAVACPYFVERGKKSRRMTLERFLEEVRDKPEERVEEDGLGREIENNGILPTYHCMFCKRQMNEFGMGFITTIGSSTMRCPECESLYKLWYDEKIAKFVVLFAEEKGDVFRENFEKITGTASKTIPYTSTELGIAIPKEGYYTLDKTAEIITIDNWIGKLSELNYIVTRSKKDQQELTKELEKDYSNIRIINGEDKLTSPKPTAQEIGIIKLLREIKTLNKRFCDATLKSRITVLEELKEDVEEEERQRALREIRDQRRKLARYQKISAEKWNEIDKDAAKAMWRPIAKIVGKEGFSFPGRGLGRNVNTRFKPHAEYWGYSEIDVIINGLFNKISEKIKEYCSEINLCWDGLPGICHKKTHGGIFGLHLDLIEPFKLITIARLCKAILNKEIEVNEIENIWGRRRQKMFYVKEGSGIDEKLNEIILEMLKETGGEKKKRITELKDYFREIKKWLGELVEESYHWKITHHKQKFQAWTLINYQIWEWMTNSQKERIEKAVKEYVEELQLTPFVYIKNN